MQPSSSPEAGYLEVQDVDEPDVTPTVTSHLRKIEDVIDEQLEFTQNAVVAACKSQMSSLRDRLQVAYANAISGNADRMEALPNELQKLRRENLQLREALGTGIQVAEAKHEVTLEPTVVKLVPSSQPADNVVVGADYVSMRASLPGAIDACDDKVHRWKSRANFCVDGVVHLSPEAIRPPEPPSLPKSPRLNAWSPRAMSPRPSVLRKSALSPRPTARQNETEEALDGDGHDHRRTEVHFEDQRPTEIISCPLTMPELRHEMNHELAQPRASAISAFRKEFGKDLKPPQEKKPTKPKAAGGVFADVDAMKEKVRQTICEDDYDVTDFYKRTGYPQMIARARWFDIAMLTVISLNAIWIGYDADYNKHASLYDAPPLFIIAENTFCVIFFIEWLIRFLAFEVKSNVFKDAAFLFDTALVILMVIETWLMSLVIKLLGSSGDETATSGVGNASVLRVLRLMRLTRMARMARILRAIPELMILVKGMMVAMRSVILTLGLMVVVLYVFGIAFTQLARDTAIGAKYFPCVGSSMNTLLLHATILEGMPEVINEIGAESWLFRAIFLLHILLASLTVLNMLVGVLVEVVSVVSAVEKEQLQVNFVKARLCQIISDLNLDADNNGMVSLEEFELLLEKPQATRALRDVGVDVVGLVDFKDYIFVDDHALSFSQFMEVVLSLRGTNKATVKDVVDVRKLLRTELGRIEEKISILVGAEGASRPHRHAGGPSPKRRGYHFG